MGGDISGGGGKSYFKGTKGAKHSRNTIHVGRQGKHNPGHINYQPGRVLEQCMVRVSKYPPHDPPWPEGDKSRRFVIAWKGR